MNQECASKEIAGYAFGTYLPPLFTGASAEVTAHQGGRLNRSLINVIGVDRQSPLLLLEGPPLSYFAMGDISYAEFFAESHSYGALWVGAGFRPCLDSVSVYGGLAEAEF